VLVVDDDPGMLNGLKRLLREYGFETELFDSAEAFETHGGVDRALCVILDVNLNGVSGLEVCRRLRRRGFAAPVILITGNDCEAARNAAAETGCLAYLTKPFSARSLIDPIARISAAKR
jgi:FixJ family two-component response regulator